MKALKRSQAVFIPIILSIAVCMVSMQGASPSGTNTGEENNSLKSTASSATQVPPPEISKIDTLVQDAMTKGKIPGISLIVIYNGTCITKKGYGYADTQSKTSITPKTLFKLGSCSKSFTALAALKLAAEGRLDMDAPVTKYIPWFKPYKGTLQPSITSRQLMYHTSGLSGLTLSMIPVGTTPNAVEEATRIIARTELLALPGEQFLYTSINYTVLGLIIEKVTEQYFLDYMNDTFFPSLGLNDTSVERAKAGLSLSTGYKMGFFKPRPFDAPPIRGNNPGAYIISNADDIERWLKLHLMVPQTNTSTTEPEDSSTVGISTDRIDSIHTATISENTSAPEFPLSDQWRAVIEESLNPDLSIKPDEGSNEAYAGGWGVTLSGKKIISHMGINPNYSAYVGFCPDTDARCGVAVLANRKTVYTEILGSTLMNLLLHEKIDPFPTFEDTPDKKYSIIALCLAAYLLMSIYFLIKMIYDHIKGKRRFNGFDLKKTLICLSALVTFILALVSLHWFPEYKLGYNWKISFIWTAFSFSVTVLLAWISICITFINILFMVVRPRVKE